MRDIRDGYIATRAFSLVELSIVLVILGLMVGGVLSGQSLIRAAELRSLTSEHQRYTAAIYSFKDKYFGLPGDLSSATQFWGADPGGCNAFYWNTTPKVPTCDGNGDGMIEMNQFTWSERYRAWQHLANAGLVEGAYTGTNNRAANTGETRTPGVNIGGSKLAPDVYWLLVYYPASSGDPNFFDAPARNVFAVSGTGGRPLKPEEAWNLDTKVDDGSPAKGRVRGYKSTAPYGSGCSTTDASDSLYAVTTTSKTCSLIIDAGV